MKEAMVDVYKRQLLRRASGIQEQQSGKCHCRDRQSLSEVHGKKFIFITGGKET